MLMLKKPNALRNIELEEDRKGIMNAMKRKETPT